MNKLVQIIIGMTITVIICASLLVPVINGVADGTTVHNTIGDRATLVEDAAESTDTTTIVLSYATPGITINGEEYISEATAGRWFEVFESDELAVHYQWQPTNAVISISVYSETSSQGIINVIPATLTIEVSEGVINYSYQTYNLNRHCEWYSYLDKDGAHAQALMYTGIAPTTVYFTDIEQIRGCTVNATMNTLYSFVGTDVEVNKLRGSALGGELTATYTEGQLSSNANIHTMEVGRNTGDYTIGTSHPFGFVVPYEVHADAPGISNNVAGILSVIPLLVIVSILTGAVYTVTRRE